MMSSLINRYYRSAVSFPSLLKESQIDSIWIYSIFFIFMALILLGCEWRVIHAINIEVSDFAANSLLVQDAKSFKLLVGEYSRVGFNHPGPAIFYVFALGELFLYDWLHIVPSPFSGQLVTMVFINSLWITLIFRLFQKLTESWLFSVFLISLFLLILTGYEYQALLSPWLPFLYILPFATMVFSLANLVHGKLDTLFTFSFSAGYLINGHICFIPIMSVILIFLLFINLWLSRDETYCPRILKKQFIYQNRNKLLFSVIILFIFFLPLILETILYFPGPVPQYIKFGNGNNHHNDQHTFLNCMRFLSQYWGGKMALLQGLILTGYILYSFKTHPHFLREKLNSILIASLIVTFAFFIYIKFGIDKLEYTYVGLFYYSIPTLLITIGIFQLFYPIDITKKKILICGLSILCLMGTYRYIDKPIANENDLKHPEIIDLYNALHVLKSDHRIVLDLKPTVNMWIQLLGVELYAKRRHENFFCINEGWLISYTKAAKCTTEEIVLGAISGNSYTMTADHLDTIEKPVLESLGYLLYRRKPVSPFFKNEIISTENHSLLNHYILYKGWSFDNNKTAVTIKNESHLFFQLEKEFSGSAILDMEGFLSYPYSRKNVKVFVNDKLITEFKLNQSNNKINLIIPIKNTDNRILDVKFLVKSVNFPAHRNKNNFSIVLNSFKIEKY